MAHSSELLRLTQRRTDEIFAGLQRTIHEQTDRVFAALMAAQWVFGIAAAYWISPRAWAGPTSQIHLHVWAAIFLGGAISAFPIALAILYPGRQLTRYTIAVGQMLTSALLIHLTGGRIETHFHVFGSLAFLAFYRDWRVLVVATVVIAGDHLLRGIWWPQSVFGILTASPWRAFEHAGWVVFEDTVLVAGVLRGNRELWRIAERTAEFETSDERYRAIVEQTGEGIFVFDVQTGVIIEHNPAFRKLLGATSDDMAGVVVNDAMMPGEQPLGDTIATLLSGGVPLITERALRRADGTILEIGCNLSATTYAGIQAVCVVVRDITERKRMQAAVAHARDAAVESGRLKSEFLANMSHEIRTPMNGVVGMTGLLIETDLSAQQRDFAETIRDSADSLLTIINDILDFSKVDAGKLHFERLDFDLRHALEGTVDLLAQQATAKGLEIALLVEHDVPTALRGDPGRLRQVLTNLMSNGIKFTEGGEVYLRASLEKQTLDDVVVRFEVRDTGIGVSNVAQARLFEAFTQADGSTTRKYGGTGLGLAIAKRLVELMSGEIGVKSVVGSGSTFWFTARFQRAATIPAGDPLPTGAFDGRRLLIVDDNGTNRRILQHQLEGWGVEHEAVASGPEALTMLRQAVSAGRPFALAIIDQQMPGMDGVTLAHAIKNDPVIAQVRLVMLTSMGDHDSAMLANTGIAAYMTKPVKHTQLRECLAAALSVVHSGPISYARELFGVRETRVKVASGSKARVLVAEDNIVNQKVALFQLHQLGYLADAVANGAEAIEALGRIPYDLILMDCQMPELDGFQATRAIRLQEREGRRIPIIAMTANALPGDRALCLAAGMDDYVSKPVKALELQNVLARWEPQMTAGESDAEIAAIGIAS